MIWTVLLVAGMLLGLPVEQLIDARTRAYEANFRNDAAALKKAISELSSLTADQTIGAMALYYAAWTEWVLAGSEFESGNKAEAIHTAERSVGYARRALERKPEDAEVVTMLTNALVAVAVLDRPRLPALAEEVRKLRAQALALAPANPRVVLMDAGMIFNNPPERGGSQEKGLARWLEAMDLFEREAREPSSDPLSPRWGRDLAYGWLADLYLSMTPPRTDNAREAANMALKLRPDFWYVKERVLPRLAK